MLPVNATRAPEQTPLGDVDAVTCCSRTVVAAGIGLQCSSSELLPMRRAWSCLCPLSLSLAIDDWRRRVEAVSVYPKCTATGLPVHYPHQLHVLFPVSCSASSETSHLALQ
ncbi:uncharacterized protein LOC144108022 [Amblyomma americanum]